jgi:hypothetical protein
MYYTYAHYTADKSRLFYVGKGKNNRLNHSSGRSQHWKSIVAKFGLHTELLAYWDTEEEAFEHEKFLIECLKPLTKLCNHTNGGEGISGYVFTEEQKQKLRNKIPHNFGKPMSDEQKNHLRNVQIGIKRGSHSIEHSQKIANALSGKKKSDDHAKKCRENAKIGGQILRVCPSCQTTGFGPNIFRYHFKNCQSKEKHGT